jgi:alpha-1,3-rhamnosyl/mannosyltransferase
MDVVAIEPFGMGDAISHEPLLQVLRSNGLRVAFCARPEWRALFPDVEWIDANVAWGRHAPAEKYVLGAYTDPSFRQFFASLRFACRGAIGIDTRGDIRNVILLYLAGCRQVITLSNYLGTNLRTPRAAATIIDSSRKLRRWELNLNCTEPLGIRRSPIPGPSFPHLKAQKQSTRRVGLVPVAPWTGKWWQPEKWSALIDELRQQGFEPIGLCGPGQMESAREQLAAKVPMLENNSVESLANELQRCAALITLDSGPMHLADALGIPVVALFGLGALPLWAPSGPQSAVVSHQRGEDFRIASPTEKNSQFGREAMSRIQVPEVMAALRAIEKPNSVKVRAPVKLAFSLLCENPNRQTALTTFFREYLIHPLNRFPHLEWIVFAGRTQLLDLQHPRLTWVRDYPANDQLKRRLVADHFKVGPRAAQLGAAGLLTIGFTPVRAGLPVFMGVNSLQFLTRENRIGRGRELYREWTCSHGVRKAALVITNSEFAASKLRTAYPFSERKLIVSHEGTQEEYKPDVAPGEVNALKKELGIEPGYLFWASNFYGYKQAPLFLEAYADLPESVREKMPVVMVGGDWEGGKAAAEKVIRSRGIEKNVRILGWIDFKWLPVLYRHALAYVLPSREETFGRTTTEAMASGTPCLLHDIPIMHEIAGDAALIINFNNRPLVVETLLRLHREPELRAQLGRTGLERSHKFSFERMAVERVQAVLDWLEAHP